MKDTYVIKMFWNRNFLNELIFFLWIYLLVWGAVDNSLHILENPPMSYSLIIFIIYLFI